jgi:hypothetical protein
VLGDIDKEVFCRHCLGVCQDGLLGPGRRESRLSESFLAGPGRVIARFALKLGLALGLALAYQLHPSELSVPQLMQSLIVTAFIGSFG